MPCTDPYASAGPTEREKEISKVFRLCDEARGLGPPDPQTFSDGQDPRAYRKNVPPQQRDELVSYLCGHLQRKRPDEIARYSLEMQMWWRDHQKHDAERVQRELEDKKNADERQKAIQKLTPYEQKLLGITK